MCKLRDPEETGPHVNRVGAYAAEIALNHHEHWDGGGYPGSIDDLAGERVSFGPGKQGEEIPLFARIVALADFYVALGSKRSYEESFSEEKTLELIETESGRQFDPEVVQAFLEIREVIAAIREKYREGQAPSLFGDLGF